MITQTPYVVYFASEQTKTQGNEHFHDNNLQLALHFYLLSIAFFRYYCPYKKTVTTEKSISSKYNELRESIIGLLKSLFLNLAAVYLKCDYPDEAIRSCDEALKLDKRNTKALYRKAKAYMQYQQLKVENWKLAIEHLETALREEPNHPEILSVLQKAKVKLKTLSTEDVKQKLSEFTGLKLNDSDLSPVDITVETQRHYNANLPRYEKAPAR